MTQEFDTPDTAPEPPISSDDFAPSTEALPQELRELNLAIEIYPSAAANYLARGDYFRRQREFVLAAEDYRRALDLANRELEQSQWGFTAQVIRDSVLLRMQEMGLTHEQA